MHVPLSAPSSPLSLRFDRNIPGAGSISLGRRLERHGTGSRRAGIVKLGLVRFLRLSFEGDPEALDQLAVANGNQLRELRLIIGRVVDVLGAVLLVAPKHVTAQSIACGSDLFEKGYEVAAQRLDPAERDVVGLPEHLVKSKSIQAQTGAPDFPHDVFGEVGDVSFLVIEVFRQSPDQSIELVVAHAEVQRVSNRLDKIELPILADRAEQYIL